MGRIGITTTVPSEVIFAAGHTPVDLNNIFIGDEILILMKTVSKQALICL